VAPRSSGQASGEWREKLEEGFLAALGMTVLVILVEARRRGWNGRSEDRPLNKRCDEQHRAKESGEWREKLEERFLAALGMTVLVILLGGKTQ